MVQPISRRQLLRTSGAATFLLGSAGWSQGEAPRGTRWYDVREWGVEGKGWKDTERFFDRLPSRARGKVRDAVWSLSRHSAGMMVRFRTDSRSISVRYGLLSSSLAMPHMPATGVSGIDLYGRLGSKRDQWVAVTMPNNQKMEVRMANNLDSSAEGTRLFSAYLPLYNGTETLEIGVEPGARFEGVPPRAVPPVVFYGTSIMHGACASRPGLSISALVGRELNVPTINLGFSGNGRMEAEVGEFLCELDAAVYAIDCLPNMQPADVAARTEPLVSQLRKARPETPILLVEDRSFTSSPFFESLRGRHAGNRKELTAAYERLKDRGTKRLGYLKGEELLGDDGEAATDGSHPNDLGFVRYSAAYVKALKKLM